jgi:putative heme-binding domain-containing protein
MVRLLMLGWLAVLLVPLAAQEPPLPPSIKDTQSPKYIPPPPEEAARRFKLPPGFEVTLFAGEPDVRQPIAMTFDDRGRLWVAECYSYPDWKETGQDRILIFEDVDGDGRFDKRSVFLDKLPNLTGILWGHGGIWACCAPNLVFIPDRDGDDRPDGPAQVVLDGWSTKTKHNIVNSLAWGPDGWLYGCHGILAESLVGHPGDPPEKRTRMNCGVWRYKPPHPQPLSPKGERGAALLPSPLGGRGVGGEGGRFEVVAHGTTNPWGLDWNEHGEAFFTNCVIGHLWHLIPGAHYKRMYGLDYNPHVYELIDATSDHLHWGGGEWTQSRGGKGAHSDAGGGHAHSGAMVYLGDNWPDEYRGRIYMCNIHGNRLNANTLERQGCGYAGKRAPDFMMTDNEWFRGVALTYGPDGGVYVLDWCDHGECHDDDGVHRSSGRIYKVIYRPTHKWPGAFDLSKQSDKELVELLKHKNAWWARQAQRVLAERHRTREGKGETYEALVRLFKNSDGMLRRRALWTLHACAWTSPWLFDQIADRDEYVRSFVIQQAGDGYPPASDVLNKLAESASNTSPVVRLHLASALQQLPANSRWPIATALSRHEEDAEDRCQPLLIWYGIEPAVLEHKKVALELAGKSRIPKLTRFIVRRLTEGDGKSDAGLDAVIPWLAGIDDDDVQVPAVRGLRDGLRGRKQVPLLAAWPAVQAKLLASNRAGVRSLAVLLALQFDAPGAVDVAEKVARDSGKPADERVEAVQALIEKRAPALASMLFALLNEPVVRAEAIRGLAAVSDDGTPAALLNLYSALPDAEKQDIIATLASRPKYAHALLDAVEKKTVARSDISTFTARQIQDLGDKELSAKLTRVWGELRQTSAEKRLLLEQYKARLPNDVLAKADLPNGRRVFEKNCAQCHKLHGQGGTIGPDLTGSNRTELHYVLENTLDPSAVVGRDYQLTNFLLHDGRLVAGIIVEETSRAVTVQTANERLVLAKDDIDQRKPAKTSMMPEGMLEKLSVDEVRDLVGYLREKAPPMK